MTHAQPGTAEIQWGFGGERTVTRADPVILVAVEVLDVVLGQDGFLILDTAGEYRYRFVREHDDRTHVYERIQP